MRLLLIGVSLLCLFLAGCTKEANPDNANNTEQVKVQDATLSSPALESEQEQVDEGAADTEQEEAKVGQATNIAATEEEKEFIQRFYGDWTSKEQEDVSLRLVDGKEEIGVKNGQMLTVADFSVTEINAEEQWIVIHGYSQEISYDEEIDKVEFTSKLYLQNNGEELLYVYDYLGESNESLWGK
ncbi:hypothetical protein [Paenibacillus sp. FSL K6-1230]|uniref:hypothetical protein n=1 Tax=Paenibacillus sp. FSL K6-1230 TaxID=2921603 RepID=UPI0030F7BB2A